MPSIFAREPALTGESHALDRLIVQDELAFVQQWRAKDHVERRHLLCQGAGRAFCNTARAFDRIEALIALHALAVQDDVIEHLPKWGRKRASIGAEGWGQGKPMMALLHVGAGSISVRRYQRRFDDARGWQKLVEERCIAPDAYTERFGVSFDMLKRWCDQGVLTSGSFAVLLRSDATAVMHAVAAGEIQTQEIFQRCATEDEAVTWAQRFLRGGIGPCPLWMEGRPTQRALALELAQAGQLHVDQLLNCVPRIDPAAMQALRDAGHATAWHALRAGLLPSTEVQALVHAGHTPLSIVGRGTAPQALVRAWVQDGVLDKHAFVQASLGQWRLNEPMPPYHYEAALHAWGPYLLLRNLPMPKARNARLAYAARQMAVHLWHRQRPLELARISQHVDGASAIEGLSAASAASPGVCGICLEAFSDEVQAAPLLACAHAPCVCRGCLLDYAEKSDDAYPVCIKPDCKRPVLPEDVVRCGGSVNLAHSLALDTVRRQLAHSVIWWACPTRGCVGGTLLGVEVGSNYQCRVCEQVAVVRAPNVDWRRDSEKIMRLVDGLQSASESGEAPIRECPNCGVPTEHSGGCAHMKCRECGVDWNFSVGLASGYAPRGMGDEQTYVPRAGLLVTAGLYEGVAPGPGLYQAVLVNAKRLQLMPNGAPLALTLR